MACAYTVLLCIRGPRFVSIRVDLARSTFPEHSVVVVIVAYLAPIHVSRIPLSNISSTIAVAEVYLASVDPLESPLSLTEPLHSVCWPHGASRMLALNLMR